MLPAALSSLACRRTMGVEENESEYKYGTIRADANAGERCMEVFRLQCHRDFRVFRPRVIGSTSSILLDHIVTWIRSQFSALVPYYALIVIMLGAIYPFYKKTWNKDAVTAVFSILKVLGLIGLLLAEYTPLFDWLGCLFYPFTLLLQIPEPLLAAKASAIEIAEMFLPALLVTEAPLVTKFIIAVVSVSAILFFSAVIPCILSTEIPLSLPRLLVIWFERTVLTLILTAPLAYWLL